MINKIKSVLLVALALFAFVSCEKDGEIIDPSSNLPVISYPYDSISVDLNEIDNLPIIAFIKSEAGLRSVELSIITTESDTILINSFTDFFNDKNYSLSETMNYKNNFKSALVTATDKLNRVEVQELPIEVADVVLPPVVTFDPERIEYDDILGGVLPKTKFIVTSTVGLKRVEMVLVTADGQEDYGFPIEFSNNEMEYTFDEMINYNDDSRGFIVKAFDIYDQIRISTLPVVYKSVPPPTVTFIDEVIIADKGENKVVEANITSASGVVKVDLFRVDGDVEVKIATENYSTPQKELKYSVGVEFVNATSGVKLVATDNIGKSRSESIGAVVNINYAKSISIGTHTLTEGNSTAPDIYALLSLRDMKSYKLSDCLVSDAASSNVDFKVYAFGSSAALRIYSIDGGTGTKSNEYKFGSKTVMDMPIQNNTKFLKVTGRIDFESATVATIEDEIISSQVVSNNINPIVVGDVIAFKTGAKSTSGAFKIGIMKLVSDVKVEGNNPTSRLLTFDIKIPKE